MRIGRELFAHKARTIVPFNGGPMNRTGKYFCFIKIDVPRNACVITITEKLQYLTTVVVVVEK